MPRSIMWIGGRHYLLGVKCISRWAGVEKRSFAGDFVDCPVFNLLLFLGISGLILSMNRVLLRIRKDVLSYGVFGWLARFGFLSASGRLNGLAGILVALGLTLQITAGLL